MPTLKLHVSEMSLQMSSQSASARSNVDYTQHAKRWVLEIFVLSVIGGIINLFIISAGEGFGSFVLAFLVYVGVVLTSAFLLFRHVDTLILKHIVQAQEYVNE